MSHMNRPYRELTYINANTSQRFRIFGVKNLAEAEMNHHHRKILHSFFAHPMSANIAMKDVERVFRELGANIKSAHSGKMHVTLNGHNMNFTHASHSLHKVEVHQVKNFRGCPR
jgi:hypothetical protein